MLDYKPPRKRRKPRIAQGGRRKSLPVAGVRQKVREQPHRTAVHGSVRRERQDAKSTVGLLGRVAFAAVVFWLMLGLAVEGFALWRAPLSNVEVVGNRALSPGAIFAQAGLVIGTPLAEVRPLALAGRMLEIARIESAEARRVFPGRVILHVRERVPAAIVETTVESSPSRFSLVDVEGRVLAVGPSESVDGWPQLPRIRMTLVDAREGMRISGKMLRRGLDLVAALKRMAAPIPGQFSVNVDDPAALVVDLPQRRQRLILPPKSIELAIRTYQRLFPSFPPSGSKLLVLDLRTLRPSDGGRIVLRR